MGASHVFLWLFSVACVADGARSKISTGVTAVRAGGQTARHLAQQKRWTSATSITQRYDADSKDTNQTLDVHGKACFYDGSSKERATRPTKRHDSKLVFAGLDAKAVVQGSVCRHNQIVAKAHGPVNCEHSRHVMQLGESLDLNLTVTLVPGDEVVGADGKVIRHRQGPFAGRPVIFGEALSETGQPLPTDFAHPDFFSLFQAAGGRLFSLQHFENPVPSMLYLIEYDAVQQRFDGSLVPLDVQVVRQKDALGYLGGQMHCSGSVTPWSTHLGSEEWASPGDWVDVRDPQEGQKAHLAFFDSPGGHQGFHPYRYGYVFEVSVTEHVPEYQAGGIGRIGAVGFYSFAKHYAMGRISHEMATCLPDRRTCYMSDDWEGGILLMFKADRAEDLSAGSLYAARPYHRQDASTGKNSSLTMDIEWVDLGHAKDEDFHPHLTMEFGDLMEKAEPSTTIGHDSSLSVGARPSESRPSGLRPWGHNSAIRTCPPGFVATGSAPPAGGHECLRLRPGAEILASRFEPRRVAAMLGASVEFSRLEGIAYDPTRNYLYGAFTTVDYAMLDAVESGTYDAGGPNLMRWPRNLCGCVVAFSLGDDGRLQTMWPVICGEEREDGAYCAHDSISGPDNLAYSSDADGLLIAEDTTRHDPNVLWMLELSGLNLSPGLTDWRSSKQHLKALVVVPKGAEVGGAGYYPNINGFAYMTLVAQHPESPPAYPAILGPIRKCCNASSTFNIPDKECKMPEAMSLLVGKSEEEISRKTAAMQRRQADEDRHLRVRSTTFFRSTDRSQSPHPEELLTCSKGRGGKETLAECMRRKLA